MEYSSASEGEIIESEGETKATTEAPPYLKDGTVDRADRPRSLVSRSSRPLQLDGAYDEYDDGGLNYDDGQSKSRSDAHRRSTSSFEDRSPRGQKRPHPDDPPRDRHHSDKRRFKVHYEGRDESDRRSQRYDDRRDRNGQRGQQRLERDTRDDYQRSGRGLKDPSNYSRYDTRETGPRPSDIELRRRRSSTHSREERGATLVRQYQGKAQAAVKEHSSLPNDAALSRASTNGRADVMADGRNKNNVVSVEAGEQEEPPKVDENALIAERQKRREAMRAKHKQEAPLLHQALHVNSKKESQPASPLISASSPSTSQAASPGSPALVSVADDSELANRPDDMFADNDEGEGPSAADYDPSMDMQEDRVPNQQVLQSHEAHAATYNEKDDEERKVIVPKTVAEKETPKGPKEFDMFADDDDDDMFAPETQNKGHKKDDGTQAVHIPEAKQLDRSLLDDWDDPDGYYRIILGELLDSRYHVQTNLGKGVFSAVVRALDTRTDRVVAIKIIRKQESMYRAGMKEIETLQTLAEADPEDKKHLIRLERHFEHKGHLCMVFENLSINLREVLKKFGRDVGINIKAVRSYAQQMFLGLSLLRKCDLIHADLKPDNVLVNESRDQLKIADLGSAIAVEDNEVTDILVSRFYRAPEVMLGIKGDAAIDMWSIGCTLFELYTGKICFTGPTNNQMLKGIMECRGKIPNRMLKKSEFWAQHFEPDGTFLSQEVDSVTRKETVRKTNIVRTVPAKEIRQRLFANSKGLSPVDAKELSLFSDLLDKCLALDPQRRITPQEALKHGFISRAATVAGLKA